MKINLTGRSSEENIYSVNDNKLISICFHKTTNEIKGISLIKIDEDGSLKCNTFRADGLLYLENVCHGEDNEILDTNLLCMAERCFSEVC